MDSTKRFGSRVSYYTKFRPRYPEAVYDFMRSQLGLNANSTIADVGSGTGISAEPFLKMGCKVFCIEPNAEMRTAAETALSVYPNFASINGRAEETGLSKQSIDFVVAGQAFHWFDPVAARTEFLRILKPGGWIVLLWNDRRPGSSFANAYENLLKMHAVDYDVVDHRRITNDMIAEFFGTRDFGFRMFDNRQILDLESLKGRVMSCSYMPEPDSPGFDKMTTALSDLFQRFQENGTITMEYNTLLYYGIPSTQRR